MLYQNMIYYKFLLFHKPVFTSFTATTKVIYSHNLLSVLQYFMVPGFLFFIMYL